MKYFIITLGMVLGALSLPAQNVDVELLNRYLNGAGEATEYKRCYDNKLEEGLSGLFSSSFSLNNEEVVEVDSSEVIISISGNVSLDQVGRWKFDYVVRKGSTETELIYYSSLPDPVRKSSLHLLPDNSSIFSEKIDLVFTLASELSHGVYVNRCPKNAETSLENEIIIRFIEGGKLRHQYIGKGHSIRSLKQYESLVSDISELFQKELASVPLN